MLVAGALTMGGASASPSVMAPTTPVTTAVVATSAPYCYPPGQTPVVAIKVPSTARWNKSFMVSGTVTRSKCNMTGATVALYASANGRSGWKKISSDKVKYGQKYGFTVKSRKTVYFKVVVAKGKGFNAAQSRAVRVRIK
jgi:hypothetical protein